MKSMTKMMVVAMVLVAALVVAPAAARTETITTNATVFIGEENLNFSGATFAGVTQFVHYTDRTAGTTDRTLAVVGGNISELAKGIPTGTYWAQVTPGADTGATINVQNPEVTLDVVLNTTGLRDSVNGKSVARTANQAVVFKLSNNLNGYPASHGTMNIELTLPGGGVTTEFGGATLKLVANGATVNTAPASVANAAAGTYTAQAKWPRDNPDFYGKGFDSNTVTFEVTSKALSITSTKDSVVRGNSFAVTIAGESRKDYRVEVRDAGNLGMSQYPLIIPGQTSVKYGITGESDRNRTVTTNAGGSATVQFNTTTSTDARTYTIRVTDPLAQNTYDEVKVRVQEGDVTVTVAGTGVYYIGEEITLSGTCTDNDTVHIFMTGPNLGTNGVNPDTLVSGFVTENVEADDTWSYKWATANLPRSLDAGGYTFYAVSKPVLKDALSNAKYSTASVQLRSGFITATTSGATVARGDDVTISGTAQGNPSDVRIWMFGKNYYGQRGGGLNAITATVESDGSFEEDVNTDGLSSGQYFVVVQHPMGDNYGVNFDNNAAGNGWIYGDGIVNATLTNLQASEAANALITALDSPNVRDTYVKLTFVIEEPNIFIDPIGDKAAGSKFTISGTTNLAVGDTLNVEVTSAAFQPGTKTEASSFSSAADTATVQKGDGANTWSMDVDATGFKPDQYIVKVEAIETGTTATATFNVVAGDVTTQPTGNVTTQPTETATTTATTTTEPTPTTTPGFGALLALAGLGAVAFLVLRRN